MRPAPTFKLCTAFAVLAMVLAAGGAQAADSQKIVKTTTLKTTKSKTPGSKAVNPFQGFSSDNGVPVDVTSESIEMHQEDHLAVFSGNVVARKGVSTLCAPTLTVYYDTAGQDTKEPTQTSSIKKLEASGGIIVTARDQVATGKSGVFDMAANTATLVDNVKLTQGPNVIKGDRLVVNLKTGVARVTGTHRISSLFQNTKRTAPPEAISCTAVPKPAAQ